MLLTAQIHQGIRLSPLKVLVSLVFRPASNLLLRLLHICNNATFALLHSKRHVRSERLNKLRERCLNRAHLIQGASGREQGRLLGGLKKKRIESNYEPYPGVHRELKWPVQFLVQNNVAFQLKDVHYKALLKVKRQKLKKIKKKTGNNHTRKVSWPCSVARRG